jgi:hypothetical protein
MYESDIQSAVSEQVIDGEVDSLNVCLTDNDNAIIINIGYDDAAYTADEAREFAESLETVSDEQWNRDNDDIVEYIRDLADIVDNERKVIDVARKWAKRDRDDTI